MDLDQLRDARIVPFLVGVLNDQTEAAEVRIYVVKRLRNRRIASNERGTVALAVIQVLRVGSSPDLRFQSALALAEFTDIERVIQMLRSIALDLREPIDLPYSAFTSLERAGPVDKCAEILRQLAVDEALGRSARSLLSTWKLK